jgi:hypothetical protein
MGSCNKFIDGGKMVDIKLLNKGLVNECIEISEVKTEKRNIDEKAVDDILASLEEQKAYWLNVKTKVTAEKAKL